MIYFYAYPAREDFGIVQIPEETGGRKNSVWHKLFMFVSGVTICRFVR